MFVEEFFYLCKSLVSIVGNINLKIILIEKGYHIGHVIAVVVYNKHSSSSSYQIMSVWQFSLLFKTLLPSHFRFLIFEKPFNENSSLMFVVLILRTHLVTLNKIEGCFVVLVFLYQDLILYVSYLLNFF